MVKLSHTGNTPPLLLDLPFEEADYRKAYYAQEDKLILLLLKFQHPQQDSRFKNIMGLLSAKPTTLEDIQDYDNFTDDFIGETGSLTDHKQIKPAQTTSTPSALLETDSDDDKTLQDIFKSLKKHKLLKRKLSEYHTMKREFDALDESIKKLKHRWNGN